MRNNRYFLMILIIGLLVRAWPMGTLPMDSDQAVVGLMGKHILEGAFPWIYYGDSYSGTLEPGLVSWAFFFNGINRSSLHFIPFCFSILFLLSIYQLGRQLYNRTIGLMAMFLACLPPFYFGLYSAMAYGGYTEILWLGNLILLLTHQMVNPRKPFSLLPLFFLGLLWGITWWTHPLGVIYLLTSGLFIAWQKKEFLFKGKGLISLLGFFLGSLPFWIWNGLHQFPFLKFTQPGAGTGIPEKINLFLSHILQVFILPSKKDLMFLVPWEKAIPIAGIIFIILIGSAVILLLTRIRGQWLSYPEGKADFLLLLFFFVFVLTYLQSRFIELPDALRYLLPLYTLFPITLALLFQTLRKRSRILFSAVLFFSFSFSLYHNLYLIFFYQNTEFRYQKQLEAERNLFRFLKIKKIRYAYAPEYWSAPALTFNALEDPVFTLPFKDRYPLFTLRADASSNVAFVLEGKHRQSFEAMFSAAKGSYQREIVAPFPKLKNYFVYYEFKPPANDFQEILPEGWKATSNVNPHSAARAFDREISTDWTSSSNQSQGLYYQIDLGESYLINHIILSPGLGKTWAFPCSYKVHLSLSGTEWKEVASVNNNWAYLFWSGGRPYWKLRDGRTEITFPPQKARHVRISLTEPAPYPWSIGEIFIYQKIRSGAFTAPSFQEIIAFLKEEKSEFVYADIGLSAEITQATGGKIKCLLEDYNITQGKDYSLWGYNGAFPYGNSMRNQVDFSLNPAFVIARENNPSFLRVIEQLTESYRVKDLGDYLIYTNLKPAVSSGKASNKNSSVYYWSGTHLLKMGPPEGLRDDH